MAEEHNDEILTVDQAADLLKVSHITVYKLVSAERKPGKIFAKKVGREWRILRKEVDRYLCEEPESPYQATSKQCER